MDSLTGNRKEMKRMIGVVLCCCGTWCFSQSEITAEQKQQASQYYAAGDWNSAIKSYQVIVKADPQNWNAKMRLGVALTSSGKPMEALPFLKDAVEIAKNAPPMYYLASAYASLDNKEKAFEWLDQSLQNGLNMLNIFESDPNLANLKNDPRYTAAYERLKKNVHPCLYLPEMRQFDFWIGRWNVQSANGQFVGESKIEKILDDCVILENWTSAAPNRYAGKSFNLYNTSTGKWMQTWVDDKGGVSEFIKGEYKEGTMQFVTLPDKQKKMTRLTFTRLNENLVRQHFEVTTDDGKIWTTTTDLYYHRIQ